MLRLIMDTSNQYLLIALYKNEQCLEVIQEMGVKRQSENAIPALSALLQKYNIELLDIHEMIITLGPGSYTGVRVAMTIAKTLSVISPIKIKAVSSLASYAALDNERLILIKDFDDFMRDYKDFKVVGQCEIVGYHNIEVDLANNIYHLALNSDSLKNVDALVPRYLKDVEAKKICL